MTSLEEEIERKKKQLEDIKKSEKQKKELDELNKQLDEQTTKGKIKGVIKKGFKEMFK